MMLKNFNSDKLYVISLLHLWNMVLDWNIACSAWDELLKQLRIVSLSAWTNWIMVYSLFPLVTQ